MEPYSFRQTLEDKIEATDRLSPEQIVLGKEYWARSATGTATLWLSTPSACAATPSMASHSDKIREIECIRRIFATQPEDIMTADDPVAFTKDWVMRRTYDLNPNLEVIEYVCEDNNRNPIGENGATVAAASNSQVWLGAAVPRPREACGPARANGIGKLPVAERCC